MAQSSQDVYRVPAGVTVIRVGAVAPVVVPSIRTQPANASAISGQTVILTVGATGGEMTFQWQRNVVGVWTSVGTSQPFYSFSAQFADNGAQFRVIVSNNVGSVTSSPATVSVSVAVVAPVAGFSAAGLSGTAPLSVTFTDQSSNTPTNWVWDFEGQGRVDSLSQNPTYVYSTPGTYSPRLTASNAAGSNVLSRVGYVTVTSAVVTTLSLSGPSTGTVGSASSNFTVTVGNVSGTLIVTPTSSPGATITPSTLTFSSNGSQTFTVTTASANTFTIGLTNNGGVTNPSTVSHVTSVPVVVPTTATLSIASSATVGVPLQGTITLNAAADQTYTFTLTAPGATLSSSTVSIPTGQTTVTFTVTQAGAGSVVVDFTITLGPQITRAGGPVTVTAVVDASVPAWLTAPAGQWAQISGTSSPYMLRDYSGVAFVDDGTTTKMIAGLGGGHAGNSTDNSMHAVTLSADAPAWQQLRASGSSTGYNSSTMSYFPEDGSPGPRHLYHGVVHWPERNAVIFSGTFWALNGSDDSNRPAVDGFNLLTNAFEITPAPSAYPERVISGARTFNWHWTVRSSVTGFLYALRQEGDNQYVGKKMNPTTLEVTDWHPATGTLVLVSPNVEDKRRGAAFYFGPANYSYWSNVLACGLVDFATGAKTAISIDTGSAAYADFNANLTSVNPLNGSIFGKYLIPALARDDGADCYYWYNGADGVATEGQRVYKITPEESGSWYLSAVDGAGVTVPSSAIPGVAILGTYSMHFSEKWRTLILPRNRGNNIHYLRVPFSSLLYVRSGSVASSLPYTATVLPLRGEVPAGQTIISADDTSLKATVLSTHDDGSAAVVVVAGATTVSANSTKRLSLGIASASADTALTAARIGALVSNVTVNFGGGYGSASITDFSTPERVWWANSKVICARYRAAAPTPGSTALEAVIDITAYGTGHDRALVEVVIENGKIDALASSASTYPADATYTGSTVSVNGATVATVNSSAAPTGTHQAFRSWYAKGWVGTDPQTRATQRHIDLQRHPLFWRCDKNNSADLSVYASDAYAAWSNGRHRASNMGGTGDDDTIGPLPMWEARALQTGDYRAWNAAEQNALAVLSYNVNYRDSVTGLVPDSARMPNKFTGSGGNWPQTVDPSGSRGMWEAAHQPAAGLMAFVSRPSPVFIEIAQKIAVWTGTDNNTTARLTAMGSLATDVSLTDMTGITPMGQVRGYAWGMRQTAHATFLSPDGSTWRTGGRVWLGRIARYGRACQLNPKATLNVVIWPYPGQYSDHETMPGYQTAEWMHHFVVGEAHKAAAAGLITDATEKSYMAEFADWVAIAPVRFVNEQADGGWRYVPYSSSHLRADLSTFTTYAERRNYDIPAWVPPTVAGQWYGYPTNKITAAEVNALGFETTAQDAYDCQFWYALVAAVERGVPGALTAWNTVRANLTDLSTWRNGFATAPKYGSWPRRNI